MLDENLFALQARFHGSKLSLMEPARIDESAEVVYDVNKDEGSGESYIVVEPVSHSTLASLKVISNKLRVLQLDNPPQRVECKYSGLLSWEQRFEWEKYKFEWRRSVVNKLSTSMREHEYELYMIRKPDADWLIASYRPSSRTSTLQILDYQLRRVDFDDLKGLEIAIIAFLSSFVEFRDSPDAVTERRPTPPAKKPLQAPSGLPAQPAVRTAKAATLRNVDVNDLSVSADAPDSIYIKSCLSQLQDTSLAFVIVRAESAEVVAKAIRIAAEVKTRHLKASGEELHQYVRESKASNSSHIPRIDLGPSKRFEAPKSVQIYLSRLAMPELEPRPSARPSLAAPPRPPPPKPAKTVSGRLHRPGPTPPAGSRSKMDVLLGRRSPS